MNDFTEEEQNLIIAFYKGQSMQSLSRRFHWRYAKIEDIIRRFMRDGTLVECRQCHGAGCYNCDGGYFVI